MIEGFAETVIEFLLLEICLGPLCRNRHVRRVACKNYINGFCPKGRECKYAQ